MEAKKNKENLIKGTINNIIYQRAVYSRKISRLDDLDNVISGLLHAVNIFNSIKENEYVIDNFGISMRVEDLKIPKELSFLLVPMSIRINPLDLKTRDVKVIPDYQDNFDHEFSSYNEYIDYINRFRGYFKRNGSDDLVNVQEVRKHIALFDVLDKVCVVETKAKIVKDFDLLGAQVHYFGEDFWPYIVNNSIKQLFESNYFNTTFKELSNDFLYHLDLC